MTAKEGSVHLAGVVLFVITGTLAMAQSGLGQGAGSCRQFAQRFYSWYVPITQKNLRVPASDVVLRDRPAVLAPALLRALKADSAAQEHANGDIVGIDFDPFLGGQDPAKKYALRKVVLQGDRCLVEVWRLDSGDNWKPTQPDVVAELSWNTGHWLFEDFHYPDVKADLMKVLAALEKERQQLR